MSNNEVTVLMVAEKPSIANSISLALGGGKVSTRKGVSPACSVHEFSGRFLNKFNAHFKVTSVIGHVFSTDFYPEYQSWETVDPLSLFDAPIRKIEANANARVCKHLSKESKGCDFIVLWLDCDREGENICFEVLSSSQHKLSTKYAHMQQIFRAKFSAITPTDIARAMSNLGSPNKNEALAVDARQEIDLKLGVAFTRYQTRYFQGKYGDLDSSLISYGPCQIPTLGFCVDRYNEIQTFQSEPFWNLQVSLDYNGRPIKLEWERGKLFNHEAALLFEKILSAEQAAKIVSVKTKEARRTRPVPLNTVELLKIASNNLGIGPSTAMHIAERLYISGFISYPRTESTKYPENFDLLDALKPHAKSEAWGEYVRELLTAGVERPKAGVDHGDHPPITPTALVQPDGLRGDDWRLYDYITRHFIATLSPDSRYQQKEAVFKIGNEIFRATGKKTVSAGFIGVMPWLASTLKDQDIPDFEAEKATQVSIRNIEISEGKTSPPDFLTESELISLMEKNGIGTDASIPVHINNICERNYVQVDTKSRTLKPTHLGIALVHGYHKIDPDLVLPTVRSAIEKYIDLIAQGKANFDAVVKHTLDAFKQKFMYFTNKINLMDELFQASFNPVSKMTDSKLKVKCGLCRKYMHFIHLKPTRLHCPGCEVTYNLPQNGSIKLYKELQCPLDNFELVLFSFGSGQKSYPLCPYCYNSPSLEGMAKGLGCNQCPHPSCIHSVVRNGICECPECEEGVIVLDPASGPKWRADCNLCRFIVYLPAAHKIACADDACDECGAKVLEVNFNKNDTPLPNGETFHKGCLKCDEMLNKRLDFGMSKTKHPMFQRGVSRKGKGKGRGRGKRRG